MFKFNIQDDNKLKIIISITHNDTHIVMKMEDEDNLLKYNSEIIYDPKKLKQIFNAIENKNDFYYTLTRDKETKLKIHGDVIDSFIINFELEKSSVPTEEKKIITRLQQKLLSFENPNYIKLYFNNKTPIFGKTKRSNLFFDNLYKYLNDENYTCDKKKIITFEELFDSIIDKKDIEEKNGCIYIDNKILKTSSPYKILDSSQFKIWYYIKWLSNQFLHNKCVFCMILSEVIEYETKNKTGLELCSHSKILCQMCLNSINIKLRTMMCFSHSGYHEQKHCMNFEHSGDIGDISFSGHPCTIMKRNLKEIFEGMKILEIVYNYFSSIGFHLIKPYAIDLKNLLPDNIKCVRDKFRKYRYIHKLYFIISDEFLNIETGKFEELPENIFYISNTFSHLGENKLDISSPFNFSFNFMFIVIRNEILL